MSFKAERVTESCVAGEGPHWDAQTQSLFFVDIFGKSILKFTPGINLLTKASTAPKKVSFIIPVEGRNNEFVVAFGNELTLISWDGTSDNITIIKTLAVIDSQSENAITFNDAKCDSAGRIWTGTNEIFQGKLESLKAVGSVYSFDSKRGLQTHASNIRMSNGIAFNEQTRRLYYIDSMTKTVDQFDLDTNTGTISNRKVLFTLPGHISGLADGMTIDTDGNLWVAVFGAGKILKIDGNRPETLLESIELPTPQVTSLTFGGPNLDELYVTTAALEFGGFKPEPPVNGAVYRITGTGSRGFPGVNFKPQEIA